MTLEEEKRFSLLASVLDIGGRGRKHQVLDNIFDKGYLKFEAHDLEYMPSRKELFWRNNLAYVRKHLVRNRYLDGSRIDNWEITEKGRSYFLRLSEIVTAERSFRKLTPMAVKRALQ